ncbi:MAG TPA: outer membrane beta-barrel family protein, partial [Ferruginibacter sp.]|nr:outer membrane beta-barrel family protein [Ferruginibacter sp.]
MKGLLRLNLLVLLSFCMNLLHAQMPIPGGQGMNVGHFYGKLTDGVTSKGIEGASVQLIQNKLDTATKKKRDFILSTLLSDKKGDFSFEGLPVMGSFKLRISTVGYKQFEQKVAFELNMNVARTGDMSSMLNAVDKDLGNIKLEQDARQLQNVTVSASNPLLQLNLDRKVYNVEKDLTATGGTAVDVMKNVPSVNVDIEGNVTLRNAPPQIFIDGRPTTLTLDQIPADQIASVEIITNPSAKYDASGGGSGILNIVLKKNRKAGYNGNVRASIDSRARPGFGGDLNFKQNKVNFFAAAMVGFRKSIGSVTSNRTDYLGSKTAHLSQFNRPVSKGVFAFGRLGLDYFIDNRNTLTISGNIVKGRFKVMDEINIYRDTFTPPSTIVNESSIRNLKAIINFRNYGSAIGFKHNFSRSGKEWTVDGNYNYNTNDNTSDYNSKYFDGNNNPRPPVGAERAIGGGTTQSFTAQTDYIDPFTKTQKIELGFRASVRNSENWNDNYIQDYNSGKYILTPSIGVLYKYTDAVYAGYLSYSQQVKKFSYQAGIRVESSEYDGTLVTKSAKFSNAYPFSFFPSLFMTYKLSPTRDLQLNYSRKINRPNFFQIIPFIDYSDSLNLTIGNPNLVPEFTNLVEFSFANQYGKGHSLLATLYGKNTDDLITRYQYRDKNPNPLKIDSVLFTSYANASRSYTIGFEITGKNKITKWWDITSSLNFFDVTIEAGNLVGSENNSQFSWFVKLNNSFKLPKNFSIQLTGDYQAKTLLPANSGRGGGGGGMFGGGMFGQTQSTAQGYIKPVYGADIAFRKDFLKNNA